MENQDKMLSSKRSLKSFLKSAYFKRSFLLVAAGGLAGFLFFFFVGCKSGTCPITANPYSSIITGSLMGFLLIGSPKDSSGK